MHDRCLMRIVYWSKLGSAAWARAQSNRTRARFGGKLGHSSVKWVSISSSLHGQAWAWKQCVSFISRLFSIFRSSDYMPKLKKESLLLRQ